KRIYEYCLKTVKKQGKSAFISLSHIFALLIATLVAIIVVIQAHFEMLLPKRATTNPNSQAEQIHKN
ncbi:MAG: hypothetical protein Q8M98_05245, partial [Candidatus Cloacimonadaceae bacterium]|nr:hypothetical protein [Candidatus Cloacimonadaceae bacterium]